MTLLSINEAAKTFGISRRTVERNMERREWPFYMYNGHRKLQKEEIEELIMKTRIPTVAETLAGMGKKR